MKRRLFAGLLSVAVLRGAPAPGQIAKSRAAERSFLSPPLLSLPGE